MMMRPTSAKTPTIGSIAWLFQRCRMCWSCQLRKFTSFEYASNMMLDYAGLLGRIYSSPKKSQFCKCCRRNACGKYLRVDFSLWAKSNDIWTSLDLHEPKTGDTQQGTDPNLRNLENLRKPKEKRSLNDLLYKSLTNRCISNIFHFPWNVWNLCLNLNSKVISKASHLCSPDSPCCPPHQVSPLKRNFTGWGSDVCAVGWGVLSKMYFHKCLESRACFTKLCLEGVTSLNHLILRIKHLCQKSLHRSPQNSLVTLGTLPSNNVLEFSRNSTPNLRCYFTQWTETKHLGGTYFAVNHDEFWKGKQLIGYNFAAIIMKCQHEMHPHESSS